MDALLSRKIVSRTLIGLILVLAGMGPSVVFALGVGAITLESSLNQPLNAKIDLLGATTDELEGLSVNLAPNDVYNRMGIERGEIQENLKFRVDQNSNGDAFIRVYTLESFGEPFLNFLIEVNWPSGRLLREFTILLDPPVFEQEEAKPVSTPGLDEPPPETISDVQPDFDKPMEVVPSATESLAEEPEIATETLVENLQYGPVKRGENLWKIANSIKPSDLTLQQVIMALYKQNPEAFFGNNVSMLKEGSVLRLDDIDAARRIPVDKAIAELARHHQDWLAYKREKVASRAVAAESIGERLHGESKVSDEELAATRPEEQPVLKLVTPSPEESQSKGIDSSLSEKVESELNHARIELAMANEMLEASRQENQELRSRISALESQLESMKKLVELRDKEMQLLQQERVESPPREVEDITQLSVDTGDEGMAPAAEKEPEQSKEIDIFSDTRTIVTLGLVVVLLLSFFYVVTRSRQRDLNTPLFDDEELYSENKSDAVKSEAVKEVEKLETKPEGDLGFGVSEIPPEESDEDEFIDPISEADVYLAYGKYDKAKELLRPAIEKNPERHELKLKLLEVFSLAGDKHSFDSYVEEFYAALAGDRENPLWGKAAELAKDVSPDNQLFSQVVVSDDSVFSEETKLDSVGAPEFGESTDAVLDRLFEDDATVSQPTYSSVSTASAHTGSKLDSDPLREEDVPSLAMSDLELSQLESIAPGDMGENPARSEPMVSDRGLTSMLENFEEPDIGSSISKTVAEEPVQTRGQTDIASTQVLSDVTAAIPLDEHEDSIAVAEALDSLFEEQQAVEFAQTQSDNSAIEQMKSAAAVAENEDSIRSAPISELETIPDLTDVASTESPTIQSLGLDGETVPVSEGMSSLHDTTVDVAAASTPVMSSGLEEEAETVVFDEEIGPLETLSNNVEAISMSVFDESTDENLISDAFLEEDKSLTALLSSSPVSEPGIPEVSLPMDSVAENVSDVFSEGMDELELHTSATGELPDVTEVTDIFAEDAETPVQSAAEFEDTTMFLLADEVGTKLDLARAYIEMGDKQGAIELLREVQAEGDDKQRSDAEELLALAG
ncbi:MAG: hypothetical protein OEZ43_10130 [Gammaproteobacteria bacterium]|nr:hypothetical protein [Gammaproteobacteria bacterium]